VGERLPFHATALGKSIAANLDPAVQQRLLESSSLFACTPATQTTVAALRTELDLARARGYAIESEEHDVGVSGVAVAILDHSGRPIGAIDLSGPSTRLDPARLHELASRLIGAARRISHSAGGTSMSIAPAPRPTSEATIAVTCVANVRSLLGEGPCWDPRNQVLYWVDILKPALHRFDPATGIDTARSMDSMVSIAAPRARGGLIVAAQNGIVQLDFDSGRRTPFAHPEEARPANRYNDGKCDRRGRLWIGSLDMGTTPNRGSLFRVDADGSWQRMDSGFTVSNGIGFSPDDKRMYFVDSGRRTVYVYDFDLERGEIAHRRPFVELAEGQGLPDGLTVDADGFVWLAVWDGWTVIRYDPEGRVAMRLPMPVPRPTSCCFGGADLRTLYITTASVRLPEQALAEAPFSGALFACTPGAIGLAETPFAG
jgi:sugar lactone lactonase YvrE